MKGYRVLLDANILLRLLDPRQIHHSVTIRAIRQLGLMGAELVTVPQSFYEFWVVATRPLVNNGMGLTPSACERWVDQFAARFPIQADSPTLFSEWLTLVRQYQCSGKVAHDTRYVAAMRTQGISRLLTFNTADFSRYPGITLLDPQTFTPPPGAAS